MAIIETKNLTHLYSEGTPVEKSAIRNINLQIEKGEFVGIIGHTGSGKSTLIQHFNGLLRPTSGEIFIDGENIWQKPKEIRRFRFKVGLVFQYPEYQLFEETVGRDIAFGPKNMGLDEAEVSRRVLEAAEMVGLKKSTLDKSPFELSGGQKRRAAIAGVIAMRPQVLILDEPTAGLDPRGREKILKLISDYHKIEQNTVLLVSHSMEDIANYTPRALVMHKSGVFMHDDVDKVFAKSTELENMGLSVPQITKICAKLAEKGYHIDANTFTVAKATEQIMAILKEKKGAL